MAGQQKTFATLHPFARAELDAVLTEPLPQEWKDLLRQLHERENQQSSGSDPSPDEVDHDNKSNSE